MSDSESELYHDDQQVLTCRVCACRYPATRRRLAGEIERVSVCTDRCRTLLETRMVSVGADADATTGT
ncbi:MAG: hypothetical protein H0W72_09290 [Planctomycetes bacterium]|nr:hypothetical protein [Planctomycetota bacterium]